MQTELLYPCSTGGETEARVVSNFTKGTETYY